MTMTTKYAVTEISQMTHAARVQLTNREQRDIACVPQAVQLPQESQWHQNNHEDCYPETAGQRKIRRIGFR